MTYSLPMRTALLIAIISASPALACSPSLHERLDQPLRETADDTFDVSEVQSVEGGEWKVWQRPDGSGAEEVVRIDYGEMARLETRLVIDGPDDYAITQARYLYSVPMYLEGSTVVRIETDIYMYCDGALVLPSEDFGVFPDYVAKADEAAATFRAEEIAEDVPPGL